jgi:hypothetical protein
MKENQLIRGENLFWQVILEVLVHGHFLPTAFDPVARQNITARCNMEKTAFPTLHGK